MQFKNYKVTIDGQTPLLMHHDNIQWADTMAEFIKDPNTKGKEKSKAGDDRKPAWTWIGSLYTNNGLICIPSDNIMTLIREGGKRVPTGKKGGTYMRQTQSGVVVDQVAWPVLISGNSIPYDPVKELIEDEDFSKHEQTASDLGFSLFVKRAKIGKSKHIRVRPRFDEWSISGTVTVFDESITKAVLQMILTQAGAYCGLGDWRPSSPMSPGSFGKFLANVS